MKLPVLYEDAYLLAIHKPEGLAAIPERDPAQPSARQLLETFRGERLFVVHRLDKEASGVLLFARTPEAHRYLNALFATRRVHKIYRALVHGCVSPEQGQIQAPIRAFGSGRMGVDFQRGKPSETRYRVLAYVGNAYTLLEALPLTGRRHQIRVHCYHLGHPIVGDLRYGDRSKQQAFPRLMLHALTLRFPHPEGPELELTAPLPESFQHVLDALHPVY
ncbi:RluA family pseudouridine synthase [Rhodothermus bifroesti]|uniref:RluA family pseudouridine synthase n=1 Tax=Rhodothermus marinus TaxID=29549 RepID=A0A7V2B267_RHOMR|nr:RluA family pseudouridine synthase [Rhodothermus bifroesti]GBD01843.1 Ribosomal large subunit pseudouridine synthase C [bacterium HR18]